MCLVSLMLYLVGTVSANFTRSKRIINGETIEAWNASYSYNALRYLATIGTLHTFGWFWHPEGDVDCSGAFITPSVIQTACHCLSHVQNPIDEKILPARVNHEWEDSRYVFLGVDKEFGTGFSMIAASPLKSKKFLLHQGCAKLHKGVEEVEYTHDYGWITVDGSMYNKLPFDRLSFAPLYTLDELDRMWEYFQGHRPVCLHLGLGQSMNGREAQEQLRLGWTTLLSQKKCIELTSHNLNSPELLTWVCTIPFSKHEQSIAYGDVGGPLTCNNLYFAVASDWKTRFNRKMDDELLFYDTINFDSPLVLAKYENALEWRRAFIDFIQQLGELSLCQVLCRMTLSPDRHIDTFRPLHLKDSVVYSRSLTNYDSIISSSTVVVLIVQNLHSILKI